MQETKENTGLIPGLGRSPGGGNGNPLQYSCLENPMDRGADRPCSSWDHKESGITEATEQAWIDLDREEFLIDNCESGTFSQLGVQQTWGTECKAWILKDETRKDQIMKRLLTGT